MYFTSTSTEGEYLAFFIIFVKIVSLEIMWAATVCQTCPRIRFKIANIFNWFDFRIDFGFYLGIDFSFYVVIDFRIYFGIGFGIYFGINFGINFGFDFWIDFCFDFINFVRINIYFVQIRFASRIAIFNCFEIVAITLRKELELNKVHIFWEDHKCIKQSPTFLNFQIFLAFLEYANFDNYVTGST